MKVYCNAFWPGFVEGTDPVSVDVFLTLLSTALDTSVTLASSPESADILLESLFGDSILRTRTWTYTVFFSGESRICPQYRNYDCVLWGESTQGNVVCCPEFIPYLYSTGLVTTMEHVGSSPSPPPLSLPKPRVCVVISNPGGPVRNRFLDILERYVPVDYAGRFRNNVPQIQAPYTSDAFRQFIGNYRCILSMENSRGGDYVTEKITHGLLAGTVPIYWGSPNVGNYFNTDRFIQLNELDEDNIGAAINDILTVMSDDDAYRQRISQPLFVNASGNPSHTLNRTLHDVAMDMRAVLPLREQTL